MDGTVIPEQTAYKSHRRAVLIIKIIELEKGKLAPILIHVSEIVSI